MAWTVEDLILSRSNSEVLEFRSCSELDDRWKICSKSVKHISIEPEDYDYDRGINRTVLVDSPNVSSFSFNSGSFDKCAVKSGSSHMSSESFGLRVTDHPRSAGPQNFSCKTTADVGSGKDMNAATGPSLAVNGNSPVPHSKRARPRLQISAG